MQKWIATSRYDLFSNQLDKLLEKKIFMHELSDFLHDEHGKLFAL